MAVATRKTRNSRRAEGREAPRPGAAPRGAEGRTGSDGEGRGGVQVSPGHGASRGGGSSGRRGRGGAPAGRSGAASRGVKVKTGGDGSGRGGVQASPGCGVSRGGGSSGRGGAPAGRSGAASRGAGVQTGSDGEGRAGVQVVARVRRLAGPGCGRARPHPQGALSLYARFAAGVGVPCAPRRHPDYIYRRVVSPEASARLSPITQSGQAGPLGGTKATSRPRAAPARIPAPCFAALRAARTPDHRPEQGESSPQRPDPTQDARPGITGVLSRCAGRPTPPSPRVFTQVREVQWFQGWPPQTPKRRGHGDPAPSTRPDAPPCSALPHPTDRPVSTAAFAARLNLRSAGRRAGPTGRCPLPPSPPACTCPHGVPRSGDRLRPAPASAVAACLNPRSARRRAQPTSRCPCPLEPSPRGVPRRTDRPVPTAAVAARLYLPPWGAALGRPPPPRPCLRRRRLLEPPLCETSRPTDQPVPLPA